MASLLLGSISHKVATIKSSPKLISIAKSVIMGGRGISTESSSSEDNSRSNIMLMVTPEIDDKVYRMYSLAEKKVISVPRRGVKKKNKNRMPESNVDVVVGSSHCGWLAMCNKCNLDFFLSNPISGRQIQLPSLCTLPIRDANLSYHGPSARKLVLSTSPDEVDCRALMSFSPQCQLAFCVPGRSTEWTHIGPWFHKRANKYSYGDISYSSRRKRFYCLGLYGDLIESWDLVGDTPTMEWSVKLSGMEKSPWAARAEQDKELAGLGEVCWQSKYLVFDEQSDQLFLVIRHVMRRAGPDGKYVEEIRSGPKRNIGLPLSCTTVGFDVYKIDDDEGAGKTKYMDKCLDGLSFFIGVGNSFAIAAAQYPELESNSIYISDEFLFDESSDLGGHSFGVYNYQDDTLSPCYYPTYDRAKRFKNKVWFTPAISMSH